jgi:hypothetical protein
MHYVRMPDEVAWTPSEGSPAEGAGPFDVVFDPTTVKRSSSWSPGLALPITFGLIVVGAVLVPILWWLAAVYLIVALAWWLPAPINFWLLGGAPFIEMSRTHLRVTRKGGTRTEAVAAIDHADLLVGQGWVYSRDPTFASVEFVWRPDAAPGVEGFVRERGWSVPLPLRGRDRRDQLRALGREFAARGLASELADRNPPERFAPST